MIGVGASRIGLRFEAFYKKPLPVSGKKRSQRMLSKKSPLIMAVVTAIAAVQTPVAVSQESSFAIEEVVVTARQPLTAQVLSALGITSV